MSDPIPLGRILAMFSSTGFVIPQSGVMEFRAMVKGKQWVAVLAAVNIILAIICAISLIRQDRESPRIIFGDTDLIYTEGIEGDELLGPVRAEDKRDGDVSGRVVIEKIVEDAKRGQAVVYYAATDLSGNVAKASRVFPAHLTDGGGLGAGNAGYVDALTGEAAPGAGMASGKPGELHTGGAPQSGEPTAAPTMGAGDPPVPTAPPTPQPTGTPGAGSTPGPAEGDGATQEGQAQVSEGGRQEGQGDDRDDIPVGQGDGRAETPTGQGAGGTAEGDGQGQDVGGAAPVLVLNATSVAVRAGEGPAWVKLIKQMTDDKDSYEALFHNLEVSGYDANTPGSYQVSVTTKDSDGNTSRPCALTINVE